MKSKKYDTLPACEILRNKLSQSKPELEEWAKMVCKDDITAKKLELALIALEAYADEDNYDLAGNFDVRIGRKHYYLGALAEKTLKEIKRMK